MIHAIKAPIFLLKPIEFSLSFHVVSICASRLPLQYAAGELSSGQGQISG